MEPMTNEELTQLARQIEGRVTQLSQPYEDALAYRIFASVQKTFKTWLALWLGVTSLVVGLVGYLGYDEIVDAGKKKVEEQVASQVTTQLQPAVTAELEKAREQIRQTLIQNSLDDLSKLDADLAQLLSDTQAAVDQRIKEFATQLAPVVNDPDLPKALAEKAVPEKLSGYAFYGIRSADSWTERNFKIVGKSEDSYPESGDTIIAEVPVNARSGVIALTLRGWVNKPTVGLIKTGRKIKVLEVETVAGGNYVWFRFESIE